MIATELTAYLQAHGGVAGRRQLVRAGFSPATLWRYQSHGVVEAVRGRAVMLPGTPDDLARRSRIAAACRPTAVLTGPSAARLAPHPVWQRTELGDSAYIIDTRSNQEPWRTLRHPGAGCVRREGLLIADFRTTLFDLIRVIPPSAALDLGLRAAQQRLIRIDDLVDAVNRLHSLAGVSRLRKVLEMARSGAHSVGEARLHGVLRDFAVTGWTANLAVDCAGRTYVLDVAFPHRRVAVEFDGMAYHSDKEVFVSDRRRQNDLVASGWTVLRFTWDDVVQHPGDVVRRIRAALGEQVPAFGSPFRL